MTSHIFKPAFGERDNFIDLLNGKLIKSISLDTKIYRTHHYATICANAKDAEGNKHKTHISNE